MADTWSRPDLIERIDQISQSDDAQVKDKQDLLDKAVDSALERYDRDAPYKQFLTQSGDGTGRYTMPADFLPDDGSDILNVEKPTGEIPVSNLDHREFELYQSSVTVWELLFTGGGVSSDTEFKVTYTIGRSLANIATRHKQAFAFLCAAFYAESIAANLANDEDSSINTDTVDNSTISQTWTTRAREFTKRYEKTVLPKKKDEVQGAEETTAVESLFAGRTGRIFHRDTPRVSEDDDFFTA